jgi:hypothetical protein
MQVSLMGSATIGRKKWVWVKPEIGKTGWVFAEYVICD